MANAEPMEQDIELKLASSEVVYSVQKMADVLKHGSDAERAFILEEMQQLLGHCMDDIIKILLPVVCVHVHAWKIDLQLTAAASLALLVMFPIPEASTRAIARAAIQVVKNSGKSLDVEERAFFYQAWAGILVEIIPMLKRTEMDFEIFMRVVDDHISSPVVDSRKLAARLLGALGEAHPNRSETILLERILSLSEDPDVTVRGTAAESMAIVGGQLAEQVLLGTIWCRLTHFLEEKDVRIRATALRTMSQLVSTQRAKENKDKKLFKEALPPILMQQIKFAQEASEKDQRLVNDEEYTLLDVCSDVFGELLYSVSLYYQKGFRKEAFKAYVGMATCNGPIIRRNTAFNMPGVSLALGDKFGGELSAVAEYLAKDKDAEVRWILSSGIHETLRVLAGTGKVEKLTRAVNMLLVDKNPAVCMNALEHYAELVICFLNHKHQNSVQEMCNLLNSLRVQIEGSWRMQELLVNQITKCVLAFPPKKIEEVVLPMLYSILEHGMPIVQKAAMKAIITSFLYFDDERMRQQAVRQFWASCANGKHSYKMRIAMIEGAIIAHDVFSADTFKKMFSSPLLELRLDPISNVRLKLATILPSLHGSCLDPAAYEATIDSLIHDQDSDVQEAARCFQLRYNLAEWGDWDKRDREKREAEVAVLSKARNLPCVDGVPACKEDQEMKDIKSRTKVS